MLKGTRYLFTFQYASIKPNSGIRTVEDEKTFTFQYASIKPPKRRSIA